MAEKPAQIRLVAGLGNPGPAYSATRHNAGFMVVAELCRRHGLELSQSAKWNAAIAAAGPLHLLQPLTFMNRSGDAVASYANFHKILPAEILVVLDDVALPLGRLRLRLAGSGGGHNGLESVLTSLGTTKIPRLRLGINRGTEAGLRDYVLDKFAKEELPAVEQMIQRAADAVDCILGKSFGEAMNRYNTNNDTN